MGKWPGGVERGWEGRPGAWGGYVERVGDDVMKLEVVVVTLVEGGGDHEFCILLPVSCAMVLEKSPNVIAFAKLV